MPFRWPAAVEHIKMMIKKEKKWRFSEYDRLYFKGVFNYCQIIDVEPGFDFRGPQYEYPPISDLLKKKMVKKDRDVVFNTQIMDVPIDIYLPGTKTAYKIPKHEETRF